MDAHLIRLLQDGATLVTPNRRLARDLARRFGRAQADAGLAAWRSPDILPWEAWIARSLQSCAHADAALQFADAAQELALWRRVIEAASSSPLLDVGAAARSARDARALQHAWRIDCAGAQSEEVAAYQEWARRFEAACRRQGWVESARRLDLLGAHVRALGLAGCSTLIVYAFDQLPPQARELLDILAARGVNVHERQPAPLASRVQRVACADEEDERRQVAAAVRARLLEQPASRITVVVPALAATRAAWMRALDDALQPTRCLPGAALGARPYNLSLGLSLSAQPLVYAALALLRLAQAGRMPLAELGVVLRGPFLGGAEQERLARAQLDASLRRRGAPELDVDTLLQLARGRSPNDVAGCPLLAARLRDWSVRAAAVRGRRQLPSAWSVTFLELCGALGWPGQRTLDSEEFQAHAKWQETVSALARLDPVLGRVPYAEALGWLARSAADTLFQPESPEVPVQVVGVLESVGLESDCLFVTGLHDEAWPESSRPNPFLPLAHQRAAGVPHASAEWELAFAQRMLAHWSAGAASVFLTHPVRQGDRPLRPSALIAQLPAAPAFACADSLAQQVRRAALLETVADGRGAAWTAGLEVPGGVAVLERQAACAFRAFAVHRLGARTLDETQPGLAPRERGILLHRALAALWAELQSHARLLELDSGQVDAAVTRAVEGALQALRAERPDALTPAFAELERARLGELLARLLDAERARSPFRVVEREAPREIDFAGLRLRARVDRVDELDDGRRVVIDYKTGAAGAHQWYGERPDAPQLPLYALTDPGEVAAVVFASLRTGAVGFTGVAAAADLLPGVKPVQPERAGAADLPALMREWQRHLGALAHAFLSGEGQVAPKRYPQSCEYCEVAAMCRVRELFDRGPLSAQEEGDER
ncbi:MAG: PD-(D/E)XK nuclease family protein [Burkholderiales bacterium]|nr:PD-(D/E)XK nuclease family protein [Burkholderiales bacterium]